MFRFISYLSRYNDFADMGAGGLLIFIAAPIYAIVVIPIVLLICYIKFMSKPAEERGAKKFSSRVGSIAGTTLIAIFIAIACFPPLLIPLLMLAKAIGIA